MDNYLDGGFDKSSNLETVTNRFFTNKKDFNSILYSIQYNIINIVVTLILSSLIELVFPKFDPNKSGYYILFEIIFQTIIISISLYYIRKLCKKIPFYLGDVNNVDKRVGLDILISCVLISTQINYLKKIQHLSKLGINYINNKFKKKPKSNLSKKKEEIKNIVRHILKKNNNNKINSINQNNKINMLTNQIETAKKINLNNNNNNNNNNNIFGPTPVDKGNSFNNLETFSNMNNNFPDNFPMPQNSMDQNTNFNKPMEGFRSNMDRLDYNNILSGLN